MLIVQSRVESPQLAEARARVCSPLGPGAKLSREPGSMAYDFALAVRPRANNHRVVRCVGNVPVFPLPTCYFRFLSTIYSANQWRLPHKHDRREKMTLFAKWAKLWIRTPAKVAT
jgi:hypothetical protein